MPQLPFPAGFNAIQKLPKTRESLTNLFNDGEGLVLPRPGIDTITTLSGIARGKFVWNGALYVVSSTSLIKITNTTTGANTTIGAIAGNEIIDTAIGFNTAVIVVKGGEIYTLDKMDTLVSILGNDNIVSCDAVTHIDGRFVYVPSDGSQPAFFSDVGAAGTVQAASFFDAEELPDQNETAFNLRNTLYIGGTDSFELFRDTGASPVPFQRLQGARIDYGFIGGLVDYADTFAFIGREKGQNYGIYLINQGRADKISNEAIDTILSKNTLEDMADAIASRFKWRSHDILTFTLPTDSIGYFNGRWFLLSKLINGNETPWNGGYINQFNGEYYSASLKKFGKLSDVNTEYGELIPRIVDIPFQNPNNNWFAAQKVGMTISQGFNDPVVTYGSNLTDTSWVFGTGWSASGNGGICDGSQVGNTTLTQDISGLTALAKYRIKFVLSGFSAGAIVNTGLGGTTDGTDYVADGTYTADIVTTNTTGDLIFTANLNFIGKIDQVLVQEISETAPTVGMALSRNNVEYGDYLFRELGALGEYAKHLEWNYPGGLGAYDGFMGLRFYTTQNVDFDTAGLFLTIRA